MCNSVTVVLQRLVLFGSVLLFGCSLSCLLEAWAILLGIGSLNSELLISAVILQRTESATNTHGFVATAKSRPHKGALWSVCKDECVHSHRVQRKFHVQHARCLQSCMGKDNGTILWESN